MSGDVTADGSPVAVYLALPVEPEFSPVLDALTPPAAVLDLGCGGGRLANVLAERGFDVTGVDASEAMLRHVDPRVEAVHGRIEELHLGRRFDVVVLASHFANVADEAEACALLRTATAHVQPDGRVLVQHYDAASMRGMDTSTGRAGPVEVALRVLERRGQRFDAEVTYRLDDRVWTQRFTAVLLDGAALARRLQAAGLRLAQRLSPTWAVAVDDAQHPGPVPCAGRRPLGECP